MSTSRSSKTVPIVRWLDDETFFSICSRQHVILGHLDVISTLAWLYEDKQRAVIHDFPSNLEALDPKIVSCWGDADWIIEKHTIFPLFGPFQAPERVEAAKKLMKGPSIGSLKYQLGLLTGKFGAEHPLKACSRCIAEDQADFGTAYWHRAHQFPGVLLCKRHGAPLIECTLNRQWSGRFKWALPSEKYLAPRQQKLTHSPLLASMGGMILELAAVESSVHFDPHLICALYKRRIDFVQASSPEGWDAASSLVAHVSGLQLHSPFNCLPTTKKGANDFITQMTRKPRGHCHPLKHLTFIHWLFGDFQTFIYNYSLSCVLIDKVREITSVLAIDSALTLTVRPASSNHPAVSKPKKIKPDIRTMIIVQLQAGRHKNDICKTFSISVCTLNRILRSEPGLQVLWQGKQYAQNLLLYRSAWLDAVRINIGASPSQVRLLIPSHYAWLYRNDRRWLNSQTKRMPTGRTGNNSAVDWDSRDNDLYELVISRLRAEYGELGNLTVSKQDLHRLIPSLSRSLAKRTRYAKTRALLGHVTYRASPQPSIASVADESGRG